MLNKNSFKMLPLLFPYKKKDKKKRKPKHK